jgi:hypothetical protein
LLRPAQWLILAWLAFYLVVYLNAYGFWHFFQLCNVGVILACIGIFTKQKLLISSQALGMSCVALFWIADQIAWLWTGQPLHGGTAYMQQSSVPLIARVLSIYHVILPLFLLWIVFTKGYDRRAWLLQCAILALTGAIGAWIAPASENINYLFYWPNEAASQTIIWPRVTIMILITTCALYLPLHRLLMFWQSGTATGATPNARQ